jgi:uncharacterized membrane protein YeiH
MAGLDPVPAVVVGVINATGGGLLRDLFTRQEPLLFQPGQYYVLPSLIGCSTLALLLLPLKVPSALAGIIALSLTFMLRMIAVIFDLRSAPVSPRGAAHTPRTKEN